MKEAVGEVEGRDDGAYCAWLGFGVLDCGGVNLMCRWMSCARVVIFGLFSFLGFLLYFAVSFSFLHLF